MAAMNQTVYKTKIVEMNQGDKGLKIRISRKILDDIEATTYDRFNLSYNQETTHVTLTKNVEGTFKLSKDGSLYVPYILHEKRWICGGKTAILSSNKDEGQIILKFIN